MSTHFDPLFPFPYILLSEGEIASMGHQPWKESSANHPVINPDANMKVWVRICCLQCTNTVKTGGHSQESTAAPAPSATLLSLLSLARFAVSICPQVELWQQKMSWVRTFPYVCFCSTVVLIVQSRAFSHCTSKQRWSPQDLTLPTDDTLCYFNTTAEQINTLNLHSI